MHINWEKFLKNRAYTHLFIGQLRSIGEHEVNSEFGRDRRGSRRAGLHEGERGLGWLHIWDHFLPRFNEVGVSRLGGREIRREGSSPAANNGSGQESGGSAQHFQIVESLGSRKVGVEKRERLELALDSDWMPNVIGYWQ